PSPKKGGRTDVLPLSLTALLPSSNPHPDPPPLARRREKSLSFRDASPLSAKRGKRSGPSSGGGRGRGCPGGRAVTEIQPAPKKGRGRSRPGQGTGADRTRVSGASGRE